MSRSGQTRRPKKSRSSPVFTTIASSSCGSTRTRPDRKRAAPTPPASATTRRATALAPGFRAQRGQLRLQARHALGDLAHARIGRELRAVPTGGGDQLSQHFAIAFDLTLELRDLLRARILWAARLGSHRRG